MLTLVMVLFLAAPAAVTEEFFSFPSCSSPCRDDAPTTSWDQPQCSDYYLNTSLDQSVKGGDRSALELLQRRYETTPSLTERHRIGGMLLHRALSDATYWSELAAVAEDAVLFGASDDATRAKFTAYCLEHGYDEDGYAAAMWNALSIASEDSRSRPLLLRAMKSEEPGLLFSGICGLAAQHDVASLPDIAKVLETHQEEARDLAPCLAGFKSEAADQLALKYLRDEDRQSYLEEAASHSRSVSPW